MLASLEAKQQITGMKLKSLEAIFRALQEAEARYLVVGGMAVVAHGYFRFTQDLDLVLDLSSNSLSHALTALASLGYRPSISAQLSDFANPEMRKKWMADHNMKVFSLISDRYNDVTIDIFAKEPFPFETEYAASLWKEIAPGVGARIVSLPALIALKKEANRYRDQDDIDQLRKLHPPNHES